MPCDKSCSSCDPHNFIVPDFTGDKDFDDILRVAVKTLSSKGRDYTMGNADKLHNFKTVGEFCELHMMDVLGVYLYKHITALYSYIRTKGQSESEPIESRLVDIINYILLFGKMVAEIKRKDIRDEQ